MKITPGDKGISWFLVGSKKQSRAVALGIEQFEGKKGKDSKGQIQRKHRRTSSGQCTTDDHQSPCVTTEFSKHAKW